MTHELLAAADAGRVRIAIGRASDFFGAGATESSLGERVFGNAFAGKRADFIGNPDLPHTYSYIPDIAAGLARDGRTPAWRWRRFSTPCGWAKARNWWKWPMKPSPCSTRCRSSNCWRAPRSTRSFSSACSRNLPELAMHQLGYLLAPTACKCCSRSISAPATFRPHRG